MANTVKKSVTTKSTAKKSPTTSQKKPVARASATKATQKSEKTSVNKADLFILNGTTRLDSNHQFTKALSPIYGVEEYIWVGSLKKQEVKLLRKSKSQVPVSNTNDSGITLVGNASKLFEVKNALTVASSEYSDQVYNYCNPESKLFYVGDEKVHTIYVRIYDNASGTDNDRWVTISIE